MGCGGSKGAAAPAAAAKPPEAPPQAAPAADPSPVPAPAAAVAQSGLAQAVDGKIDVGEAAKIEEVEQAKQMTKEAFAAGMRKLLVLAIEGYPKALRSTMARRNELLRDVKGDQDAAAEKIKAAAAALSEEGKTWLLGLVPYVGFPAQLLYPTWTIMRRVCLLAAVFGLDLSTEDTRGRILHVFAGLRAVPAVEYGMEMACQAVWVAFAGPLAGFLPVGTLVTKVANVEGAVVDVVGRESFCEMGRKLAEAEYADPLDAEPTLSDYMSLAKDGTAFALYSTWKGGLTAVAIAQDKDRRSEALGQAVGAGKQAVDVGKKTGSIALATGVAVGAAGVAVAKDQGPQLAAKLADKAKGVVGGAGGGTDSKAKS